MQSPASRFSSLRRRIGSAAAKVEKCFSLRGRFCVDLISCHEVVQTKYAIVFSAKKKIYIYISFDPNDDGLWSPQAYNIAFV